MSYFYPSDPFLLGYKQKHFFFVSKTIKNLRTKISINKKIHNIVSNPPTSTFPFIYMTSTTDSPIVFYFNLSCFSSPSFPTHDPQLKKKQTQSQNQYERKMTSTHHPLKERTFFHNNSKHALHGSKTVAINPRKTSSKSNVSKTSLSNYLQKSSGSPPRSRSRSPTVPETPRKDHFASPALNAHLSIDIKKHHDTTIDLNKTYNQQLIVFF